MSKEDAQKAYDKAYADNQKSYEKLLEARATLDEYLREEEAERRAAFMSFNPAFHPQGESREVGKEEALEQIEARSRQKAAAQEALADGPVGGVA